MVRREAGKPSKNSLKTLHDEGQTVWLDFLSRSFLAGDGLKQLIERDGLTGVTSNPSIFEKAIAESADYDASLRKAESDSDLGVMSIYERLAIDDIRRAADDLKPVFESGHLNRAERFLPLVKAAQCVNARNADIGTLALGRQSSQVGRECSTLALCTEGRAGDH
jgi:hypothetical protein